MLDSYPPLNLTGQRFSTKDRDNDNDPNGQCALTQKGGWWYKWCTYANPNGLYFLGTEPDHSGIYWFTWDASIPFYRMKSIVLNKRQPIRCSMLKTSCIIENEDIAKYQCVVINTGDTMLFSNQPLYLSGQRFSTKDRDNDGDSNGQCALTQKDGW
ncbi:unnamed protein product [Mytilus edulis]|uniref:Fibrinogen C-terminal domain-containing protein n=1 Tax=Mytilus edulis TaxID=6550 RepID=A0A8S3U456_MYTED|nr:unnamed protein product [Mytilus edulis]